MLSRKLTRIKAVLDHYYPDPPIPLNHSNGFTFLVAVVLSAQTTDGKVNAVTKELFRIADNPVSMSKLSPDYVESVIKPVGLAPKKAQNVVALSQMIVDRYQGEVPNTFEELESLPGVGHKTASVIMSQLFGESALAVDTHVHRLALRWGLTKEEKNPDKVQRDLYNLFPKSDWDKLHLQMIYFGREYCSAKNHVNDQCPICSWVHNKDDIDDEKENTEDSHLILQRLDSFPPQKRIKGLVYYNDRVDEIMNNPMLTACSPRRLLQETKEEKIMKEDSVSEATRINLTEIFKEEETEFAKPKQENGNNTKQATENTYANEEGIQTRSRKRKAVKELPSNTIPIVRRTSQRKK